MSIRNRGDGLCGPYRLHLDDCRLIQIMCQVDKTSILLPIGNADGLWPGKTGS